MKNYAKGMKAREHLVVCAAELFLKNGYSATGINEILESVNISKGSFYFYFKSKKELAVAVYEYFTKLRIESTLEAAEGRSWHPFVDKFVGDVIQYRPNFGCPIAVLGMELAFIEPELAERCADTMKKTVDIFRNVLLHSGFEMCRANELAEQAFSIYEGYLLLYRVSKDTDYLNKIMRDLKKIA